jgi:hypothetical protein
MLIFFCLHEILLSFHFELTFTGKFCIDFENQYYFNRYWYSVAKLILDYVFFTLLINNANKSIIIEPNYHMW